MTTNSAAYNRAIEFIAFNDEPGESDFEVLTGYISVMCAAEILQVTLERIVTDVLDMRRRYEWV